MKRMGALPWLKKSNASWKQAWIKSLGQQQEPFCPILCNCSKKVDWDGRKTGKSMRNNCRTKTIISREPFQNPTKNRKPSLSIQVSSPLSQNIDFEGRIENTRDRNLATFDEERKETPLPLNRFIILRKMDKKFHPQMSVTGLAAKIKSPKEKCDYARIYLFFISFNHGNHTQKWRHLKQPDVQGCNYTFVLLCFGVVPRKMTGKTKVKKIGKKAKMTVFGLRYSIKNAVWAQNFSKFVKSLRT